MKIVITIALLLCYSVSVNAQFVTIMGIQEEVKNDTVSLEYTQINDLEEESEEDDEENEDELPKRKKVKRFFQRISNWLGVSREKNQLDTVPTNPELFSYDQIEGAGSFIFTESDEKKYLDSIKYELIMRRHQVLKRKSMVSLPMDVLKVTSHFGYRSDPFNKAMKFHNGIDFSAKDNFVNAVLPGIVIFAGYRGGYGYCVELKHGDIHTLYAHLSYILVKHQQPVPAGEPIGISGTTGRSTGEHLHFSVINKGKFVDPLPLLEYLSSILAESEPIREEDYFPSYTELKNRIPNTNSRVRVETSKELKKTREDDLAKQNISSKTSGITLLSEDRELIEGIIYQGQYNTKTNEPGDLKQSDSIKNFSNSNKNKNIHIPDAGLNRNNLKSGIILPEGEKSIRVK
ncbi:M23 family metallopeptidase [Parabacteroides merdae]|uniref:M23 family metallopeptidase n=1 Tax=Parabacteroides merdae TaxID=46503 RepID=UPI0034A2821D